MYHFLNNKEVRRLIGHKTYRHANGQTEKVINRGRVAMRQKRFVDSELFDDENMNN